MKLDDNKIRNIANTTSKDFHTGSNVRLRDVEQSCLQKKVQVSQALLAKDILERLQQKLASRELKGALWLSSLLNC